MARRKERAWQSPKPSPPIPQRAPQKAPVDWKRHIYAVLAMWVLALAAYSNSFGGELAFDSKVVIGDDPRIRAATSKNVDEIWSKGYWYNNADTSLYRPLTTLTCLLNYSILGNGARPAGYHWINFLLHSANVLLVYLLGLIVFRDTARSIALAALWAAHPVLTECVTNIVGRADLLAGFGVLAGWLCHVKALSAPGARKAAWLAGLAAASAIGIFSKESGVVLIPLMLVYDLTFRKAELRASIPGYVAAVLPVAAFLYRRSEVLATLPAGLPLFVVNPLTGLSFLASRLTAIQVIGRYLLLIVWPQRLSYDYSYNQIPLFHGTFDRWADWATLLALAVCLAAAGLAAVWYRRNRPGFFFLAVFFMALAPVGNIVLLIGTIMAERLLYLPALGLLGCLVWAIYAGTDRIRERWPAAAIQPLWIVGLLCLALAVRTHARNSDWETGYGLFASG
ncbi:MAG TPA: hypothetical protein VGS58_11430, partial [Candidatus Sulfopaludibacter sp.]|nr:hypothetical protein [Candidatus Sulfopaludibacter sp.]